MNDLDIFLTNMKKFYYYINDQFPYTYHVQYEKLDIDYNVISEFDPL